MSKDLAFESRAEKQGWKEQHGALRIGEVITFFAYVHTSRVKEGLRQDK